MFALENIKHLEVELTTNCNARCPQCARNHSDGRRNKFLPNSNLSLTFFKDRLDSDFLIQLNSINFSGNYGDPLANRDFKEIVQYLHDKYPEIKLTAFTNGSIHNEKYFSQISKYLTDLTFAIDGLEDTNHLYRIGTDFSKIISNATRFIDTGGHATWQFIVFKHNEKQIDRAVEYAKQLGFKKFRLRYTNRFNISETEKKDLKVTNRAKEYYISGVQKEIQSNSNLVNSVSCKALNKDMLYLSADGILFPCFYLAQIYPKNGNTAEPSFYRFLSPRNLDSLNLHSNKIKEVLNLPIYENLLINSFKNEQAMLPECKKFCSAKYSVFNIDNLIEEYIL